MKNTYLLGLLLLFFIPKTFAQSGQVFHLNKLSKNDTLLSGWKFQAGDNPQWAEPGFDDSKWQAADPSQNITEFKQLKNSGIGWIRLHIKVDSTLTNQRLIAWVNQFTASEMYLNGRLIAKYGHISPNPKKTVANSPGRKLLFIQLQKGIEQIVSVRLGYQAGIPYLSPNFIPLPAFCLYINEEKAAYANYIVDQNSIKQLMVTMTLFAGMFLILSIIHIIYFIYDRVQKIHLYYSIFSFSICIAFAVSIPFFNNIEVVSTQMTAAFICAAANVVGFLFAVIVFYSVFSYSNRGVYFALILVGLVCLFYQFYNGSTGWFLCVPVCPMLCMFEVIRISLLAIKGKKKDAELILFFSVFYIILEIWSSLIDETTAFSQILGGIANVGLPIAMSFYLGVQNAVNNRKLKSTLAEVQTLSERTIAQEQEKQQMLANQNVVLETQVNERTAELSQSLTNLKATQTQLIQSEKMASLGELTAGIAHEIQNPLNFVNNFSEVNAELIAEMNQEIEKGDLQEVRAIAADIEENSNKISMHGKRADSIVKGMLQHSKAGGDAKQPTNINALADEYMRLSYHGLRAKDKSFNAELVTNFDPALPKVNVIPQDIGRVLLNLFNNAFYAVNQKQKTLDADYKPEVSVTTSSKNGQVVIKVKDNGTGMLDSIKDKIMQPFFTTKPTGEGTGLGLSLSYDMVVKGHGGKIEINTKEGEFTEFTVSLPII
jgi:two-component system, NtrC family, sensor kinase